MPDNDGFQLILNKLTALEDNLPKLNLLQKS